MGIVFSLLASLLAASAAVVGVYVSSDAVAAERVAYGLPVWVWALAGPLAVMTLYALVLGVRARLRRSALEMSSLASELYFLGYLCTITTLAALVFRYGVTGAELPSTRIVMRSVAIALSTTLVGLVLMNLVQSCAQAIRSADQVALQKERLEVLDDEIDDAVRSVRELGTSASRASKGIGMLQARLGGVEAILKSLTDPVQAAGKKVAAFAKGAHALKNGLDSLGQVRLDPAVVKQIENGLAGIAGMETKATLAQKNLGSLATALEKVRSELASVKTALAGVTTQSNAHRQGLRDLEDVIESFAKLMERRARDGGHEHVAKLTAAIERLHRSVGASDGRAPLAPNRTA